MTRRLTAAIAACLLVASCGDGGGSTPEDSARDTVTTTAAPSESPAPKRGTEIVVGNSEFGRMLFDDREQAIYLFEVEATDKPECYGDCAKAWPPVLTDGEPVAGSAVDESLLGTTKRTDGSVQVTYGGHPLYYYAHEAPGEVKCHDVFLNGGNWYVVKPNGDRA